MRPRCHLDVCVLKCLFAAAISNTDVALRLFSQGLRAAALPAGSGERLPVRVIDNHVTFAPAGVLGLIPDFWTLHGRSRLPCTVEQIEGCPDNLRLHRRVPRLATGIAEREIDEQKSRYAALFYDVTR